MLIALFDELRKRLTTASQQQLFPGSAGLNPRRRKAVELEALRFAFGLVKLLYQVL